MNIDKKRLVELVKQFPRMRLAVVGDIVLDVYHYGHIRLSGESAAITLTVENRKDSAVLGCAGNVAANIRALGSGVTLYGILGPKGEAARCTVECLCGERGITLLVAEGSQTITKERFLSVEHGTHLFRADFGESESVSSTLPDTVNWLSKSFLPNIYNAVFFSDYNKGMIRAICASDIPEMCRVCNPPCPITVVDSKPINAAFFTGATLMRFNFREAQKIVGARSSDGPCLARQIAQKMRVAYAAVSLGKDGLAISSESSVIPTKARAVFDVTGAGDTQGAAMALALCAGGTILEAGMLGNYAAGLAVEKPGTVAVSAEELIERIEEDKD